MSFNLKKELFVERPNPSLGGTLITVADITGRRSVVLKRSHAVGVHLSDGLGSFQLVITLYSAVIGLCE